MKSSILKDLGSPYLYPSEFFKPTLSGTTTANLLLFPYFHFDRLPRFFNDLWQHWRYQENQGCQFPRAPPAQPPTAGPAARHDSPCCGRSPATAGPRAASPGAATSEAALGTAHTWRAARERLHMRAARGAQDGQRRVPGNAPHGVSGGGCAPTPRHPRPGAVLPCCLSLHVPWACSLWRGRPVRGVAALLLPLPGLCACSPQNSASPGPGSPHVLNATARPGAAPAAHPRPRQRPGLAGSPGSRRAPSPPRSPLMSTSKKAQGLLALLGRATGDGCDIPQLSAIPAARGSGPLGAPPTGGRSPWSPQPSDGCWNGPPLVLPLSGLK